MNIGDGLRIQTRTINGKTTTGVFLNQTSSVKNTKEKFSYKSRTVKYPLRNRSEQTQPFVQDISKVQKPRISKSQVTEGQTVKVQSVKGQAPQNIQRNKNENPARTVSASSSRKSKNSTNEPDSNTKNGTQKTKANQAPQKASLTKRKIEKNKSMTAAQNRKKNVTDAGVKGQDNSENIDTKFVTLTQGQLNTILSLVKTKHDIDVSEVLTENLDEDEEKKDAVSNGDESKEGATNVVEPESIPGLDLEEKATSRPSTSDNGKEKRKGMKKTDGKERKQAENRSKQKNNASDEGKDGETEKSLDTAVVVERKLVGYDLAGALGGLGSRERDREKLDAEKQLWIKELREQVKISDEKKEKIKQKKRNCDPRETVAETGGRGEGDKVNTNSDKENREDKSNEKVPSSASVKRSQRKGSRDKKPKENLPTRRSQEDMPAAIRSSFFIGEAAPREHAFSAKKKQENQRWREQLDLQRQEQFEKKQKEKRKFASDNDDTLWSRHFETMQPNKINEGIDTVLQSPVPSTAHSESNVLPAAVLSDSVKSISDSQIDRILTQPQTEANHSHESAMNSIFRGGHTTAAPGGDQPKNSHIRTMRALLDPAQLEALEVKRIKQEEHRRAIEAQVEERKRKKEEQENIQKRLEMEEDLRLAADRDTLHQKVEIEKMKTQMQENMREQQTQQLYHQMQEAQENALRDKLVKRQQLLKIRGHDTSRLERTHQMALQSKKLTTSTSSISQPSLTSMDSLAMVNNVPKLAISQQAFPTNFDNSPRMGVFDQGTPLSVTANTQQGPIKLEISLNSRQSRNEGVEMGVQTDYKATRAENHLQTLNELNSDAETEYLQLPQPKNKKIKEKRGNDKRFDHKDTKRSLQKYKGNLDKQYNQYSRSDRYQEEETVETGNVRKRRDNVKPKWGVGVQSKHYLPASKRYLNNAQWQKKHETNIRQREEELLEQQALNDPERLREILANRKQEQGEDGSNTGRHSPPVPAVRRQIEDKSRRPRRARSQTPPRERNHGDRRSRSPPGAASRKKNNEHGNQGNHKNLRPDSGIAATTEQAKYRENKHSRESPIPKTKDFVQYRRTSDVLDPNQPQSRPETAWQNDMGFATNRQTNNESKDPLLNPDMVRQRQRQEQILREISILRQGLLLKQREVASYPAAMTQSMAVMPPTGIAHTNLLLAGGGNLPERTNDTP